VRRRAQYRGTRQLGQASGNALDLIRGEAVTAGALLAGPVAYADAAPRQGAARPPLQLAITGPPGAFQQPKPDNWADGHRVAGGT
jgi:hypothetical protein